MSPDFASTVHPAGTAHAEAELVATSTPEPSIAILTGGGDNHYAIPLCRALADRALRLEVIGSDQFRADRNLTHPFIRFLNLHGNMAANKRWHRKVERVITAYAGLIRYAAQTDSALFHILWQNTFQFFDRTVLTAYYRLLGKRLVFTAHNVDTEERDGRSWFLSRWSLRVMYGMMDHIFVHTSRMKSQLEQDFHVDGRKITVIPFGMNTVPPNSDLTPDAARRRLGLASDEKVVLFFGNIAPYKGLKHLIQAVAHLKRQGSTKLKLLIVGSVKGRQSQPYWQEIERLIHVENLQDWVQTEIRYVADHEIEIFFKAADVCALPYVRIYQTGVMILSYRYGLPVVATDAGSMTEDVIEGRTGFLCRSGDPADLARALDVYFASELFANPVSTRESIARLADQKYSWAAITNTISGVYRTILACPQNSSTRSEAHTPSCDLQSHV